MGTNSRPAYFIRGGQTGYPTVPRLSTEPRGDGLLFGNRVSPCPFGSTPSQHRNPTAPGALLAYNNPKMLRLATRAGAGLGRQGNGPGCVTRRKSRGGRMSPASVVGLGPGYVPDQKVSLTPRVEMSDVKPKAVVLLSGGIDSATTAAIARERGFDVYALSFRYGQRHAIETEAAARVAEALKVHRLVLMTIDLRALGGSALTDSIEVPKSAAVSQIGSGIPVTYVPARNTIFLSFALGFAETIGSSDIFIGVNAVDYSGYPDCRPEFIKAFERLANVATKAGVEGTRITIHAPLIRMSKAQIIREGYRMGVDFRLTHSCYDPTPIGLACGFCDSCLLRKSGFEQAGITDPTRYAPHQAG